VPDVRHNTLLLTSVHFHTLAALQNNVEMSLAAPTDPFQSHFSSNCAGLCSQDLAVYRILQWGCIVTESQMRTTPEQNTGAIRSLSQKYNALTFKKRWFLVGANTYCNDVHRKKAPAPASAAILALPMCRIGCAAGEK
jgi:hypothetical protein